MNPIRPIWRQNGNVIWRRESARKGLNSTSGAQFAAQPLVKPVVWFARPVVNWRSRSVAMHKSAYYWIEWLTRSRRWSEFFILTGYPSKHNVLAIFLFIGPTPCWLVANSATLAELLLTSFNCSMTLSLTSSLWLRCDYNKIEHRLPLNWKMLRICVYCCITNLRSRHQEVSSIRACLSFHRLHYDWRIQYSDARDQYFLFTGRQRRFPAGTLMRKKGTRSAWRWIAGVRAWRSRENQWYTRMMYDTWDHWWYSWATFK